MVGTLRFTHPTITGMGKMPMLRNIIHRQGWPPISITINTCTVIILAAAVLGLLGVPGSSIGAVKTGPAVGATIPDFALPDKDGKMQDLSSLSGPEGLLLLIYRSADW